MRLAPSVNCEGFCIWRWREHWLKHNNAVRGHLSSWATGASVTNSPSFGGQPQTRGAARFVARTFAIRQWWLWVQLWDRLIGIESLWTRGTYASWVPAEKTSTSIQWSIWIKASAGLQSLHCHLCLHQPGVWPRSCWNVITVLLVRLFFLYALGWFQADWKALWAVMGAHHLEEGNWEWDTRPKGRTVGKVGECDMFEGLWQAWNSRCDPCSPCSTLHSTAIFCHLYIVNTGWPSSEKLYCMTVFVFCSCSICLHTFVAHFLLHRKWSTDFSLSIPTWNAPHLHVVGHLLGFSSHLSDINGSSKHPMEPQSQKADLAARQLVCSNLLN